jgi:hypothetical protein
VIAALKVLEFDEDALPSLPWARVFNVYIIQSVLELEDLKSIIINLQI